MYAVLEAGGFQFSVREGDIIRTPKLQLEAKQKFVFERVLFVGGDQPQVGSPYVEGAKVEAEVLGLGRGDKVTVFKKKRRIKYRRTRGHRQDYTEFRIEKILPPKR
jgi:large subunit ribosomal protein L21